MADENKKEYEIGFVLKSLEAEKEVAAALSQQEAEVTYKSPVTETRLAYPIQKHQVAQFGFYHFNASPEAIVKLNKALGLNQNVLRFLIITPPAKANQQTQRPEKKAPAPIVSNEALSEKLEEILK